MSMIFTRYHSTTTGWIAALADECSAVTLGERLSHRNASSIDIRWEFTCEGSSRTVRVVRNPLTVLSAANFSVCRTLPVEQWPLPAVRHEHLRKQSSSRRTACATGAASAPPADDQGTLTIRFEDLVLAPESFLGALCTYFGEPLPEELAERITRRPSRFSPIDSDSYDDPRFATEPENPFVSAERLPAEIAMTVYLRHQDVLDGYYPEVAGLFHMSGGPAALLYDMAQPRSRGAERGVNRRRGFEVRRCSRFSRDEVIR
ncbi:MAG: hypothetical protein QM811_04605 [Pirellulales bacterium]